MTCEDCGGLFSGQYELRRHRLSVHHNVRFTCPYCDAYYSRKYNLKLHMKQKHPV